MKKFIKVDYALKSEANIPEHWAKKYQKKKTQQMLVKFAWLKEKIASVECPVEVTLTRHSPRKLDDDNLVAAFKYIRDCVADLITPGFKPGRADANAEMTFKYVQETSKTKYIIITLDAKNILQKM